jgi:hypothetical protein
MRRNGVAALAGNIGDAAGTPPLLAHLRRSAAGLPPPRREAGLWGRRTHLSAQAKVSQGGAAGDADLGLHNVDAGDLLGDGVLDLGGLGWGKAGA